MTVCSTATRAVPQLHLDTAAEKTGLTPQEKVEIAGARGSGASPQAAEILGWLTADVDLGRGRGMAPAHVLKNSPRLMDRHVGSSGAHRAWPAALRLDEKAARPEV